MKKIQYFITIDIKVFNFEELRTLADKYIQVALKFNLLSGNHA